MEFGTLGHWAQRLLTSVSHASHKHTDSNAAVGEEIGPRIFSFVDYISN